MLANRVRMCSIKNKSGILISDLPINAKVKYGRYKGRDLIWRIVDKYNTDYPSGAITLMLDEIPCTKAFDGKEPSNSNSSRKSYGNNRYKYSNIRQWLNKQGLNWYKSQHSYDAPPNSSNVTSDPYDTESGFLTEFTDEEINALIDTPIKVVIPSVDGGGIETLTDKIFLPSSTEMGLANEVSGKPEGTKFPVFNSDSDRIAQYNGSNKYYWLRTPYSSYSSSVRSVDWDGSLHYYNAYSGDGGVRPLCNLKSEILVSDTVDTDGCYMLIG